MKVAFYNLIGPGPIPAPDSNLLIHTCRIQALPREDETVVVAGATWLVRDVVHLIGPGDDYEGRVWLRLQH